MGLGGSAPQVSHHFSLRVSLDLGQFSSGLCCKDCSPTLAFLPPVSAPFLIEQVVEYPPCSSLHGSEGSSNTPGPRDPCFQEAGVALGELAAHHRVHRLFNDPGNRWC